jgi:hypothetical protein
MKTAKKNILVGACALLILPGIVGAQDEAAVDPGETQFSVAAEWVRVAQNNIGYAIVGYRIANQSVGGEWMLLDVGLTVPRGARNQVLKRDAFSVSLPDNTMIPMATQQEFQADRGKMRALDARALAGGDNINYFPPSTSYPCRIGFFTDASQQGRGPALDEVELSFERACIGRMYFKIPDGIAYGQHTLNVRFLDGMLRVPFKIMTNAEMKELKKQVKEMEKEAKKKKKQGDE